MLKRTLVKGTVVLAASAAAALSACGNNATNGDDGGEGGLGGSATGGSSAGGATTAGASTGGASTGGTETGGDSNPGGNSNNGGQGGEGGAPPVLETAQDYVDYYCPEGTSAYTITEGDEDSNVYGEFSVPSPTAFVTWGASDTVYATYDGTESATRNPLCVISGADADNVELGGSSYGTNAAGYTGGTTPTLTFVGGEGGDTLDYKASTANWSSGYYRPPFVFKDFESGVDEIVFDADSAGVATGVAVSSVENFDANSSSGYSSLSFWAVVVDPVDGEIWFSANREGTQINVLVGIVEGDELKAGDVTVHAPDGPPV